MSRGDSGAEHSAGSARSVGRRRERRVWWVTFLCLVAAGAAWALSVPLLTGPDEYFQAARAAAVVRGEVTGTPVYGNVAVEVTVPDSFRSTGVQARCFIGEARELLHEGFVSTVPRDECPTPVGGLEEESVWTTQYRGQPFYYAAVGLPSLPFTGSFGIYVMRGMGVVACAALAASACVSTLRCRAPRLAVLATWLSLTPVVLYLAATMNPIGVEITAALAAWLAGLAVVRGDEAPDTRLVVRLAVALAVLALSRGLGPAFALVVLGVLAASASPGRRQLLLGRRDVRRGALGVFAALVLSGGWLLYIQMNYPLPARERLPGLTEALGETAWWLRSMVAMFGDTDVLPPLGLHLLWLLAAAVVLALAAAAGRGRDVVLALGLVAVGWALLVSGHGFSIPDTGYWWQGRYVLPLLVGALPLAVSAVPRNAMMGRSSRPAAAAVTDVAVGEGGEHDGPAVAGEHPRADLVQRLGPVVLVIAAVVHLWSFMYAARHYAVGHFGSANPLDFLLQPDWSPRYGGWVLWLLVLFVALVGAAVSLWRAATNVELHASGALTVSVTDSDVTDSEAAGATIRDEAGSAPSVPAEAGAQASEPHAVDTAGRP